MTSSATKARGGITETLTLRQQKIIAALKRYADLYGPEFTAAAFSPSTALWRDRGDEYVERYRLGDPDTGEQWPSLNSIKSPFGGSFNAAREAAGLPVNKPGPAKRRAAGAHGPVRDAPAMPARLVYVEKTDEKTLERLRRQLEKAKERADRLELEVRTLRRRKPKTVTKTKEKVKVVREKDLRSLTAAKAQAKEARQAATRAASKLERAEATINTLRAEKADLKSEKLKLSVEMRKAVDRAEALEAAGAEVVEVEVVREVEKVVERVVEMPAPEQEVVDEALRDAMLARQAVSAAERRAETSDRLYFELAQAARGEQRRLTPGEMAELRASGPAGPALLAAALKQVAEARAGKGDLAAALTAIASAALTWKDRL